MRHLKKLRETDAGQIKVQNVTLTKDKPQVFSSSILFDQVTKDKSRHA